MIDIGGLDKADVLVALYNASRQQGMGYMDPRGRSPLSIEQAREYLAAVENHGSYFDYLHGRVMKVRLKGVEFDPWLYDRDNGQGAAERAVAPLRERLAAESKPESKPERQRVTVMPSVGMVEHVRAAGGE